MRESNERGLGDTLQFRRYAVLARERNASVIPVVQGSVATSPDSIGHAVRAVNLGARSPVSPGFEGWMTVV